MACRPCELFVHVDPQVKQLKAVTAGVQVHVRVDLDPVRHDKRVVAFLISDQGIERDDVVFLFRTEQITSGIGRARFKGKTAGGPDGGKIGLEGNVFGGFLFAAAAFTGEGKPYHCKKQSTDERLAHQFSPFYRSRCKHFRYKCIKNNWVFFNRSSLNLVNL